jgi:hypothetical protein
MNLNTQYVFEGKQKRLLIVGMALGLVCLVLNYINDDEFHTRFWTNFLHNAVFFTGIAFTAMFFLSAQITAFGGWNTVVKRVWESMSQFMWVGMILMAVIVAGVWGHLHHLYHWNTPGVTDPNSPLFDKILKGKAAFLNPTFFTFSVLGVLAIWYFWAMNLRKASVDQDTLETASFDYHKKQRKWAASFLPLGGFLSTVFIWQSVMSIDSHWYSTMYAWYGMISMLLGCISITVMLIIYLKSKGYMEYVSREHLHDIGKFLFGISVFWTYLWFDQFMLIWYANNGEETIYFRERMVHYPVLFWGNLLLNFVTPFLILMRNDTKRKFGTMFFVALIVFFGHWWDFFQMIKPGARIAAVEAREIAEGKHGKKHSAAPVSDEKNTAETAAAETHATEEHAVEGHTSGDTVATHAAEAHPAAEASTHPGDHPAAEGHPAEKAADPHGDPHGAAADHDDKGFKLGFTIPGLEEIGIMLGFLSLFLFFFFSQLAKSSMVPLKDPFLEESLHHETGVYPEGESRAGHHGHDDHH